MVYTLTLNPALDYVLKVSSLKTDDINRASDAEIYYGGKGINVSVVLTRLGIENKALGFAADCSKKRELTAILSSLKAAAQELMLKSKPKAKLISMQTDLRWLKAMLKSFLKSLTVLKRAIILFWQVPFPKICPRIYMKI